ncbi:head GIN domain-containing protein [Leptobacterium sp. I13]|uniref:head GIN domain-containing protein n=1 Tax=Leptobacterium meishanense TaxID=3128904 RepID=UPI0030EF4BD1
MKKLIVLSLSLLVFANANAQWGDKKVKGNGNEVTKERNVGNYESISVAGSMDVTLVSGSEGKLTIKAEENLIPHIETEVKDGKLKIKTEKGYSLRPSGNKKIQVTVPFREISAVSLAGSGDIVSKNPIKTNSFKASVAGSGDINIQIEATDIKGSVAGSGDLKLSGKAVNFDCSVAGSGDVHAFELVADNVEVSVAGSGDARVHSTSSLKARVVGSGEVTYKGNPDKVDSKATGSGTIRKND